jgi:CubicO group peptidase (beta-lactamase class C family)
MKKSLLVVTIITTIITGVFSSNGQQQTSEELVKKIDSYLSAGTNNGFSGAISVIKNGKTIINKGYGYANKKSKTLNNANTIFDIGSNTKQFTATAIVKLVEQGKIKFEDSLSKYFKNLPNDKQNITIHQLLSHSAGLIDALGRDFTKITQHDFFTKLFASKLLSEPGKKYAYSNAGYSILGRIIELVSNQSYESYVNQQLFIPAGMMQTGYLLPNWNTSQISRGYNRNIIDAGSPITRYQEDKSVNWHLKGNGGINATQNDMILWYKALKSNKIISKESLEILTKAHVSSPKGTYHYGYGWGVKTTKNNTQRISHNGSNGAYAHSLIWLPKEDIFISYATNTNSSKVEFLAYRVEKMLLDSTYTPEPIKNNIYAFTFEHIKKHPAESDKELLVNLKADFSSDIKNPGALNTVGNIILKSNENLDWAIKIFKMNVQLHPKNGNIWDSLGDGYKANNHKKEAIESYKKAISLGYKGSSKKLKKLE